MTLGSYSGRNGWGGGLKNLESLARFGLDVVEVDCRSWELDQEEHSFFPNYSEVCADSNAN